LLAKLNYSCVDGCYRHSCRKIIFLGDFIDRGPKQREVLQIVMPMVQQECALAVMGNHEFNALAFHTEAPGSPEHYLRARTNKNIHQHLRFLDEYLLRKNELKNVLEFFWSLPLWLDLDGIRIIHACWAENHIEALESKSQMTQALLVKSSIEGTSEYEAIEALLKGVEYNLLGDKTFRDKDGNTRSAVRTRWWKNCGGAMTEAAFLSDVRDEELDKTWMPANELVGYPASAKPVFIGHYWLRGRPGLMANNVACLDYSVAKGGDLVAYRWSGEKELSEKNFEFIS
jgi:hypothetical protein